MKILICAATEPEIKPLRSALVFENFLSENRKRYSLKEHTIDILITGVGAVFTVFFLQEVFHRENYDFAINAGIGGSFHKTIDLGSVVVVKSDCFGDLGIENAYGFSTIFESGFENPNIFPFVEGKVYGNYSLFEKYLIHFIEVEGITVNMAHGREETISMFHQKFNAVVESMEGAAFYFVCQHFKTPCVQLRSISNYVEKRNRNAWKIELAIRNLNEELEKLLWNFS